ncbi:hypothetical protein COCSADRAFT_152065 [Bipolaris sorokiniana ND90Pr]|uniref:Thiolase-like protein n=1 Tax=Cochliobolus sativus (strain ND90Pr / ATCC 201652) TaxID=665912 RepID=M2SAW8_COCSN|nr:uncharacterized protein COCSADRAFT_152065 [Bipolaris sorokiniana ND90Pr]EMD59640.1 hypothetical protein COCSADRAFT_152065 [Bipolaris sorokiniana ND90Pr]
MITQFHQHLNHHILRLSSTIGMTRSSNNDGVYITGLGHQYPEHAIRQEDFEGFLQRLYPEHVSSPAVQKLIGFNTKTQISSRPTVFDHTKWTQKDATPPTLGSISHDFRTVGVTLAASACKKAIQEARLESHEITHIVAVTCTNSDNPGYDLFVCEKLGLGPDVQRVLVQGVGCAGGLSALRAAADIAAAASLKRRKARVLVIACEICSLFFRAEIQNILQGGDETLRIAPALFSDGAAALVVCNELALAPSQAPVYQLREWASMVAPGTSSFMSYNFGKNGLIATITKDVPKAAISAIAPIFQQLCNTSNGAISNRVPLPQMPADFDWAIHPGGAAILHGAKDSLGLTNDHIRASLDVYKRYGNSSSASVLVVLDNMRHLGPGRDDVAAVSFGPGLTVEMCMMTRCRSSNLRMSVHRRQRASSFWAALQSRFSRKDAIHHRG